MSGHPALELLSAMKTLALLVSLAAPAAAQMTLTVTPLAGTQCSGGGGGEIAPGVFRASMTLACHYPGTQGFTALSIATATPGLIDIGGLIGIGTMHPLPGSNYQTFDIDLPAALGPVTWYEQAFYYDPALPIGGGRLQPVARARGLAVRAAVVAPEGPSVGCRCRQGGAEGRSCPSVHQPAERRSDVNHAAVPVDRMQPDLLAVQGRR